MSLLTNILPALEVAVSVPVVLGGSVEVPTPSKQDSTRLYGLLSQVLPDQVYANSTVENREYPDCVYKIGGSTVVENLSIATGGETIFAVYLHAETHLSATTTFDAIDALLGVEEGIQITDIASDFNDETRTHEIAFEVVINTPLGFDGNGSVIALKGRCGADQNQTYPCLQQDETCQYHFIVQAKDDVTRETVMDELKTALLGYTESSQHDLLQKVTEQPLQSSGGLVSWVVTYQNSRALTAIAHN